MLLKINQNSQKNTCAGVSFNNVAGWRATTLLKKEFVIGVFLWLYKIFRKPYFVEHLRTTASVSHLATSTHAKYSEFDFLKNCWNASWLHVIWNVSLKIILYLFISYLYISAVYNLLVSFLYYFFITIFSLKLFLKKLIKANC